MTPRRTGDATHRRAEILRAEVDDTARLLADLGAALADGAEHVADALTEQDAEVAS